MKCKWVWRDVFYAYNWEMNFLEWEGRNYQGTYLLSGRVIKIMDNVYTDFNII